LDECGLRANAPVAPGGDTSGNSLTLPLMNYFSPVRFWREWWHRQTIAVGRTARFSM